MNEFKGLRLSDIGGFAWTVETIFAMFDKLDLTYFELNIFMIILA